MRKTLWITILELLCRINIFTILLIFLTNYSLSLLGGFHKGIYSTLSIVKLPGVGL